MTGLRIAPFTPADLSALPPLRPDGWQDLQPPFRFYLSHRQCLPVKAVAGHLIAGVGAGIVFENSGWLAHIITHPNRRRQGVGTAIVAHIMHTLVDKHGCRSLSLVATDLGRPVYRKAGFTNRAEYAFFNSDTVVDGQPGAEPLIRPLQAEDEGGVLDLDRRVSGEDRAWVLREHLSQGLVYGERSSITGCYLPTLGEGLILAETQAAGRALLGRKIPSAPRIVLPADNTDGVSLLIAAGYRETTRCWRMHYGAPLAWHPASVYARIAGNMG